MSSSLARGRRDAAARDIGTTVVRRPVAALLIGVFCATIMAAGVVQHVAELNRPAEDASEGWPQPYSAFHLLPTWDEIAGGRRLLPSLREITEFEDALEEGSILDGAILPRAQYVLSRHLGLGNEQVYIGHGTGRDREMFYRADVDYAVGRAFLDPERLARRAAGGPSWEDAPSPDPRPAIRSLHQALRQRDIELVLLPAPVKPVVQSEGLARGGRIGVAHNPSFEEFVAGLVADGIHVVDPTGALRELDTPYLHTDTHWTPRAMEAAAGEVAQYLREHAMVDLPAPVGYARGSASLTNTGDTAAMLTLPDGARLVSPERVEIHPVTTPDGEPWKPERDARVLLLGDSFSNIYSLGAMGWGEGAGLAEQLSHALQAPVDRITLNAGGAHAARQALSQELTRGDDRLAGKQVVVYQFAVRELFSGDWRVYEMPTPTATDRETEAGRTIVRATVVARSSPPAPGSVPYPDCVIALHLVGILPDGGDSAPNEAVAFVWGMRGNEWTRAASIESGEALRLRLTPWAEAEPEYGSYSRRELDDEDTWLLDAYWGEIVW